MRRLVVPLFAACLSLAVAREAHADGARAAEAFQRGAEAYGKNDFSGAARQFERAFQEEPRGAAMYNAGLAWEAAGDVPRAADAYALASGRGDLSPAQTTDTQSRMKALLRNVGRAEITGPAGTTVSVGHAEGRSLPAIVHLTPGTYPVRVTYSDNTSAVKQVTVGAGATATLVLERPAPPPLAAAPAPPPQPTAPPPPPVEPAEKDGGGGSTPALRYVGFTAVGVGALLGGAAIITGVKALSARDEFNESKQTNQDAHDRADSLRTTTNVLLVAGGVVAATGIVLVLATPSKTEPRTSLRISPSALTLRVRF